MKFFTQSFFVLATLLVRGDCYSEVSTVVPASTTTVQHDSRSVEEAQYRTSAEELGIEPYGEQIASRIWSPTRKYLPISERNILE